jgi:hypothetical protein
MGDLFVYRPKGIFKREAVYFLDTGVGSYRRVAGNYPELRSLLTSDEAAAWLLPDVVAELRSRGVLLRAGQCYSPRQLPVLGGAVTADNFEPVDYRVHLAITGQTNFHLKDVPDGTQVTFKVVD